MAQVYHSYDGCNSSMGKTTNTNKNVNCSKCLDLLRKANEPCIQEAADNLAQELKNFLSERLGDVDFHGQCDDPSDEEYQKLCAEVASRTLDQLACLWIDGEL